MRVIACGNTALVDRLLLHSRVGSMTNCCAQAKSYAVDHSLVLVARQSNEATRWGYVNVYVHVHVYVYEYVYVS